METTRKVFDVIRVTMMTIAMIIVNVVGSLYIIDEIMWDETAMVVMFIVWFIFTTYRLIMMEIEDVKRIIKK